MDIFFVSSAIGSVAFALSGFLVGVRKQLDIMGVFIVSMLTANGGGAIRDILVGRTPSVLTDPSAFYLVCCVIGLGILLRLYEKANLEKNVWFVLSDSIGLVAFSVTGTLVGIEAGLSIFGVMVLAFITAAGGGIIRDMMVDEVPAILSSDFYGSVALLLALALYSLHQLGIWNDMVITIAFVIALMIRIIAYYKKWQLPHISLGKKMTSGNNRQDKLVTLGVITSPHGVKGYVKIKSYTEFPEDIISYGSLLSEDGSQTFDISLVGQSKDLLIAQIGGVASREAAARLRNTKLCIPRSLLEEPEHEDDFLIEDLIGLNVRLANHKEIYGVVKAVHNFGAGDILELQPKNGKSEMVLFTKANFPEISADSILYQPPEMVKAKKD